MLYIEELEGGIYDKLDKEQQPDFVEQFLIANPTLEKCTSKTIQDKIKSMNQLSVYKVVIDNVKFDLQ